MNSMIKAVASGLVVLAIILAAFAVNLALKEPEPQPAPVAVRQETPAAPAPEPAKQTLHPVVVAAKDLEPGVPLVEGDLRLDMWPVVPAQGFAQEEALHGEILREGLVAGEPLTQRLLAIGLARHLQEGERAISVTVDESLGSIGGLTPGDRVDVFFTLTRDQENQNTQARLLLPSARILALGQDSLDGPVNAGESQRGRQQTAPRTAMLAVPLAEVNSLLLAMGKGKLQLALRSPEDAGQPDLALFAEREPVLPMRAGLSREDQERLKEAENLAFAGDSMGGLSASDDDSASNGRAGQAGSANAGGGRSVQVIRGRQSGLHHY